MEDAQAFLGQPGVGFLSMLLIGALAGWIAEKVTSSDHGIFTNILVGIAGVLRRRDPCQSPEYPGVRLHSYFGGRNHRRHRASVCMAFGTAASRMTLLRRHTADADVDGGPRRFGR